MRRKPGEYENIGTSVLEYLPKFHEKTLVDILDEKTRDADAEHPVRILDIGSGKATTLKEIEETYGDKVRTFGLTAAQYPDAEQIAGEIKTGDLSYINGIFPPESFDVIYSCRSLAYARRNMMHLYPKIYRLLKPEGVAMLDNLAEAGVSLCSVEQFDAFQKWIEEQGYDIDFTANEDWVGYYMADMVGHIPSFEKEHETNTKIIEGASMKKTHPKLRLPIKFMPDGAAFDPIKAKAYAQLNM